MDALKVITDGMIKEERPHIKVGDVVKVHVKIREGESGEGYRRSRDGTD